MLSIQSLSRSISAVQLHNVSFQVNEGDFFALFGPDGSGKTEILKEIIGHKKPKEGSIRYREMDMWHLDSTSRREIRYVPEGLLLEPHLTGKEYLQDILYTYRIKDHSAVDWLVEYFEVNPDNQMTEMTANENKIFTLIGALCTVPDLLILDEPINHLTDFSYKKLLSLLRKMNEKGMTVLITCERFEEVNGYATRAAYIRDGEIITTFAADGVFPPMKLLTVYDGNLELLEEAFGAPVWNDSLCYKFLCSPQDEDLLSILKECEVDPDSILIELKTLEEILTMHYYNEEEQG